ncbi:hypothetical protein CEUSTIGMA_g7499.t1 [Chlamydomonas eustigma]|uniref:Glycosyltransferase family 92 protein n=1 Tax=Chlamydomonas eustigma TaxID=1157962 RepID=A0A250XBB6_9CHLO|nr:hypothetical protein CEUSTIGMA_g7499.t1 [Chlamydomonas eustigma]|eukprot:GAX80060.1 hypothetical protein CEUSTIGMA_g7499.t1 [Chlamydomonas eustigma]
MDSREKDEKSAGASQFTQVDGFMFLEPAGMYKPTKWGHMNQPQVAMHWSFPVLFKDLVSEEIGRATVIEADHTDGPSWTAAAQRHTRSSSSSSSDNLNEKAGGTHQLSVHAAVAFHARRKMTGNVTYSRAKNVSKTEPFRHSQHHARGKSSQLETTRRRQIPIRFQATIAARTSCMQIYVEEWLGTKEVCSRSGIGGYGAEQIPTNKLFKVPSFMVAAEKGTRKAAQPGSLQNKYHIDHNRSNEVQESGPGVGKESSGFEVWTVLTPFRTYARVADFIAILTHHHNWHRKVGFQGTLLYASTFLIQQLLKDAELLQWAQEGSLVLCVWDYFSRFQELIPNQTYYPVPEQILINNHALLIFKRSERILLFMADVDEFFKPLSPLSTVMEVLHAPMCLMSSGHREWGAIRLLRRNHRSIVEPIIKSSIGPVAYDNCSEASLWRSAQRSLLCNPLGTYVLVGSGFNARYAPGKYKALVRPTVGTVARSIHHGQFDADHGEYSAQETCAFVLHAVNMWFNRLKPSQFTWSKRSSVRNRQRNSAESYLSSCLPPSLFYVLNSTNTSKVILSFMSETS